MAQDYTCSTCGDSFEEENSLKQHRQAKHLDSSAKSGTDYADLLSGWFPYALLGVGVLVLGYFGVNWLILDAAHMEYPATDDHWHAPYSIVICGTTIPPRPYSKGAIHTHGKGEIHIHPRTSKSAGENANLGRFFESFNGTLTDEKISIPMVGTYRNGDECDGEPGEVRVLVNGERIEEPAGYVMQDGDSISIKFTPR